RDENESAIVFIGWTSQKEDHIFKREEKAPTTIHTLTLQDKDATIYAAWGYDSNRDGIADVLETYSLAYDLNQGKGKRPESLTGLKKGAAIQLASESLLTNPLRRMGQRPQPQWHRRLYGKTLHALL
ncbi:hypothetical protein, partial [Dubosiella newyorkensis]|uniref:hypothetical protein n=1 Tax=Dubosiella newyorkensis TaxID=1862672 RepID=UPI003F49DBB9